MGKKGSCCGGFELEEVMEERAGNKDSEKTKDPSASDKGPQSN